MDRTLCTVFSAETPSENIPGPVLHPQDGSAEVPFTTIDREPGMDEDFIPGTPQNVDVRRLFISFRDFAIPPQKGDTVSWNGTVYDVFEVNVDRCGGAVLKMRANGANVP
jgi:hypothetical protein